MPPDEKSAAPPQKPADPEEEEVSSSSSPDDVHHAQQRLSQEHNTDVDARVRSQHADDVSRASCAGDANVERTTRQPTATDATCAMYKSRSSCNMHECAPCADDAHATARPQLGDVGLYQHAQLRTQTDIAREPSL